MKYSSINMLEFTLDYSILVSLSGALAPLSNLKIKIYDFHIILYFHLGQIMQNKPNFRNDKMNTTIDMTSNYKNLPRWRGQKTKPIQTQFKPNLSQNKPNSNPIKPKTKPIQTQSVFLPILPDLYILYPLTGIKNDRDGKP